MLNLIHNIVGHSKVMHQLLDQVEKIALHDVPVLIEGESGTGKELFARAIHYNSSRRDNEFVVINCSALPDTLLEAELFGHLKGAFTGAIKEKQGLFQVADNGTFFMDEIGDMSPALQVKLLRVLQEGTFLKIGGVSPVKVNLRIIAATNRKLSDLVREGKFREDLFYRVNVVHLDLPPLRDRRDDIQELVRYFLSRISERSKDRIALKVTDEAMLLLTQYNWPGNIRQLENEIEKASIFAQNHLIQAFNLSPIILGFKPFEDQLRAEFSYDLGSESLMEIKRRYFEQLERKVILEGLEKTHGNKSKCAELLRISRGDLMRKIARYSIGEQSK